jgi:hypothetical protein
LFSGSCHRAFLRPMVTNLRCLLSWVFLGRFERMCNTNRSIRTRRWRWASVCNTGSNRSGNTNHVTNAAVGAEVGAAAGAEGGEVGVTVRAVAPLVMPSAPAVGGKEKSRFGKVSPPPTAAFVT